MKEYVKRNKNKYTENSKVWQKENREKAYAIHAKYRENNRERVNKISAESRNKNKEENLNRRKVNRAERNRVDPIFKMTENIRLLIQSSFKRGDRRFKKNTKTEKNTWMFY